MTGQSTDVFAVFTGSRQEQAQKVQKGTQEAIDRLQGGRLDIASALEESDRKIQDRFRDREVAPEDLEAVKESILGADLASVRAQFAQDEKDLATALYGVSALLQLLGDEYANLGQEKPEDLALIDNAKRAVYAAEQQLETAQKRPNILGWRKKAVSAATSALQEAQERVPLAEQEAKKRARERLQNANIEDSLQEYTARTEHILGVMGERHVSAKAMLGTVQGKLSETHRVKQGAVDSLQACDDQLAQLEQQLRDEEEKLLSIDAGTSDHSKQEQVVSDAKRALEEMRTQRNNALILSQSKTVYADELKLDEVALQRLIGNLEAWILQLRSGLEERQVTFQAMLTTKKLLTDQEAAGEYNELGEKIDRSNRESVAKAAVAADKLRQKMLQGIPATMQHMAGVQEAFAQHLAEARERDDVFLREFKEQYGIDPTRLSEFSHGGQAA